MKGRGITFKLFIIIAVFFTVFTTLTILLQSLFIGDFYLNKKMKDFQNNFTTFSSTYMNPTTSLNENSEMFTKFENENNARIAFVDMSNGIKIYTDIYKTPIYEGPFGRVFDDKRMGLLASGLSQWLSSPTDVSKVIDKGEGLVFESKVKTDGVSSLVGVAPIISSGRTNSVIVAVSSLQPIGEAAAVIREFYVYFYAIAFALILIMSLIYSNMVSKPLVTLNKSALKLAELDFSSKCTINSDDEIGNLSRTLNFLSQNLNSSLAELQTANEKLKKDIEREKLIEKMRKEFVAGVSHELKTPIALIGGYAEAIKDNISNGEKRDYYSDVIIDEAEKMAMLVTDMLDISRLESGNMKLDMDHFHIGSLVSSIVKKYSENGRVEDKDFRFNCPLEDTEVSGDRLRIEQVVTNLLDNAIKHTDTGSRLSINVKYFKSGVLIEVENQGEQIPEPEIQNIWEKFYKVEKSRSRNQGGTGLGLSIVKNILNLHQSNFGVVNIKDGVKFYFTLKKFFEKE